MAASCERERTVCVCVCVCVARVRELSGHYNRPPPRYKKWEKKTVAGEASTRLSGG